MAENFIKPTKKGFFEKKREYFFEDEKKKVFFVFPKAGETAFEVSLDGSTTRSFEDMEFIVSLPIIRGKRKSELAEFLPKRGEDSSTSSSENDEKCTKGGKGEENSDSSS